MISPFITFSDSAKYASIARNLVQGNGLVVNHSFFNPDLLTSFTSGQGFQVGSPPLNIYILSLVFKFLPITDSTVIFTGICFFILSSLLVFLITKRLHSTIAALLATVFFVVNRNFLEYALNFSTEILFITLILSFVYLVTSKHSLRFLSVLPLLLSFFVRPQASLIIVSLALTILPWFVRFFLKSRSKPAIILFVLVSCLIAYRLIQPRFYLLSFAGGFFGAIYISPNLSQGAYLRGATYDPLSFAQISSKVFYNLYNFIKNPTQLASPIIFFLSLIGWLGSKKAARNPFLRSFSFWSLLIFLFATSLSLPTARYIHPVIPLLLILSAMSLVNLSQSFSKWKSIIFIVTSTFFILLPDLGHLTLDTRFRQQQLNPQKPSTVAVISQVMAQEIPKGKLIITNLDSWATWYQGLTTMWFPLAPDMLKDLQTQADYIVITNFQENDADFALGDWKEVVYKPQNIQNNFLKANYKVLTTFEIRSEQVYESQPYKGTILMKKILNE